MHQPVMSQADHMVAACTYCMEYIIPATLEVTVHAGHETFVEVGGNSVLLIADNPKGILGQQLTSHPTHSFIINIIILIFNYLINDIIKWTTVTSKVGNRSLYVGCSQKS
jgi:hypothetical protein